MAFNRLESSPAGGIFRAIFLVFFLVFGLAMPLVAEVAQISHFVSPSYPPLARQAMISGQVGLTATVNMDGKVTSVVVDSSPHPLLAQGAKTAIGEWKFQSGTREHEISIVFYYGFSGDMKESNPITIVKADFEDSTVHVYITTDPARTVHP